GCELAHAERVLPALLPRRRVRVPGAEDDRGGAAVDEMTLADLHGCSLRAVAREHTGGGHGSTVCRCDHGEIGRARLLDPARDASCLEALYGRHTHGMSPIAVSPVVSGRPST